MCECKREEEFSLDMPAREKDPFSSQNVELSNFKVKIRTEFIYKNILKVKRERERERERE